MEKNMLRQVKIYLHECQMLQERIFNIVCDSDSKQSLVEISTAR